MKFCVEYPLGSPDCDPAFATGSALARYARAAEDLGFDAIAFTDHPAPSHKWLTNGGHEAFDPLVALASCALITSRIRLMTNLLVLPYRNPFVVAKAAATVDALSGGRLTLALGTGYLRSEFAALGVDFEQRNALFDEAFDLLPRIWDTDDLVYEGENFYARGQTSRPRPVQTPHPPLWIGGNSAIARRRVARGGQGWTPLLGSAEMAKTTRTPAFTTVEELRGGIEDLRRLADDAGRGDEPIDVQVASGSGPGAFDGDPGPYRQHLDDLAGAGVTWTIISPPHDELEKSLAALAFYGRNIIAAARG